MPTNNIEITHATETPAPNRNPILLQSPLRIQSDSPEISRLFRFFGLIPLTTLDIAVVVLKNLLGDQS